ncbi:ABC transporter permease [Streptomyces minutiscleroticus]|uniref:Peptide ABC transporter permease n=1 Tax=Streptomyces minutiscleroticus TaxID=68238 RepID=A0A918P1E0_9ACTN|nr:ABC transporter permease [Streptomyces minutiscleroticus]GGY13487.1 peptide ABC transporter permease [Streptomyces minutiscleroticus]
MSSAVTVLAETEAAVLTTGRVRPRSPLLAAAATLFVLLALVLAFPGLFTAHSPEATDVAAALRPPDGRHWLGTDQLGRDVYARLVYGTRLSVLIAVGATLIGVGGGALLGLLSACGGRRVDFALMRIVEVLLGFPELLLALLVVALLGGGTLNVAIALGIAGVPSYARLVRGQARLVLRSEYVEAARVLGVRPWRTVLRHVLPNVGGPLVVLASIGLGSAIVSGAGLSVLGLGPVPPDADWGAMVADGKDFLQTAWWISVFPGLAVTVLVVATTLAGRRLQLRAVR